MIFNLKTLSQEEKETVLIHKLRNASDIEIIQYYNQVPLAVFTKYNPADDSKQAAYETELRKSIVTIFETASKLNRPIIGTILVDMGECQFQNCYGLHHIFGLVDFLRNENPYSVNMMLTNFLPSAEGLKWQIIKQLESMKLPYHGGNGEMPPFRLKVDESNFYPRRKYSGTQLTKTGFAYHHRMLRLLRDERPDLMQYYYMNGNIWGPLARNQNITRIKLVPELLIH